MPHWRVWIDILLNTKPTLAQEKTNSTTRGAAVQYAAAGFVSTAVIIGQALMLPPEASRLDVWNQIIGLEGTALMTALAVGAFLFSFLGTFLANSITYAFAKLLGGSGDYATHMYLSSLYAVPVSVLAGIAILTVPIFGLAGFILQAYLSALALEETHGFGLLQVGFDWLLSGALLLAIGTALLAGIAAAVDIQDKAQASPESTNKTPAVTVEPTPAIQRVTGTTSDCSDVQNRICPDACAAGADYDCCELKGYRWIAGQGCYQ